MEIIIGMWTIRMIRWLGWEITRYGDHSSRTCQSRGVAYCTPITFLVTLRSILVNDLAHTLSTLCEVVSTAKRSYYRVESCTHDMYRH
jgi:hypothetical protein